MRDSLPTVSYIRGSRALSLSLCLLVRVVNFGSIPDDDNGRLFAHSNNKFSLVIDEFLYCTLCALVQSSLVPFVSST